MIIALAVEVLTNFLKKKIDLFCYLLYKFKNVLQFINKHQASSEIIAFHFWGKYD